MTQPSTIGIVAIGRNEGERLRKCLESCVQQVDTVVYVDSDSSDTSVEMAQSLGVQVHELDTSIPFSAARARNEGFQRLMQHNPVLTYVQFVDGDCEFIDGWLTTAAKTLDEQPDITIVCGRLRERYPESSLYNRICDMEWNCPPGEVDASGGIFMMRTTTFTELDGFNPSVIAGEEPELCLRVRRKGGKVLRLANDMAWHDAAMTRFSQWYKRMVRAGHAYAQGMAMHGKSPDKYCVKESISIWLYALILPLLIVILSWTISPWFLLAVSIYIYKTLRIAQWATHLSDRKNDPMLFALVCMFGKFPQLIGQCKYFLNKLRGKQPTIIEHKDTPATRNDNPTSQIHA